MRSLEKLKQASIKFKNKFTYDMLGNWKTTDKIKITCPDHGSSLQEIRVHCRSLHGCYKCAEESTSQLQQKSQETYIKQANLLHNNKYSYNKTVYKGDSKKLKITCPMHGDFTTQAGSHIGKQKCGCPTCGNISSKKKQSKPVELFASTANLPDNIILDYSTYISMKTPIKAYCTYHGKFVSTPQTLVKSKVGCPKCATTLRGWRQSLYKSMPTTIYVVKLKGSELYKIGITKTCNVLSRYAKKESTYIESILYQLTILDGAIAWSIEKEILRVNAKYKYKGPQIFKYTGNTEILTKDPTASLIKEINDRLLYI